MKTGHEKNTLRALASDVFAQVPRVVKVFFLRLIIQLLCVQW